MFSLVICAACFLAVLHGGDAAPTFDGGAVTTENVPENSAVGAAITTTITATGSGTISYAIKSQTPTSTPLLFAVDSSSGALTVAENTIDFEAEASYVVVITATDDSGTTDHTITLTITNVNEVAVFPASTLTTIIIPDASAEGTILGAFIAVDPDAGDTLTYAITAASNTNTDFAASSTGTLTVETGKTLSRASTSTYSLEITAADAALTATTTVSVCVGTNSQCGCSSGASAITAGFILVLMSLSASL